MSREISKNKSRYKHSYRGIDLDILPTMAWKPKVYDDPFKFDYDVVKARIEKAEEAGFIFYDCFIYYVVRIFRCRGGILYELVGLQHCNLHLGTHGCYYSNSSYQSYF